MTQKLSKYLFIVCLCCCMVFLVACGLGQVNALHENEIVRELIYGNGDTAAVDEIRNAQLVSALQKKNGRKAGIWRDIIDYMNYAFQGRFVRLNTLPDGLAKDESLCLIVLGFELNADGTMKSELVERLEVARRNLEKYPRAMVLVADGGTAALNAQATEADSMAQWLKDNGVSPNRIIVENQSMDTLANAENSIRILESSYPMVRDLAIITSDYHASWASVNYYARIAYDAYLRNGTMRYNIVANATCHIDTDVYTKERVLSYLRRQLWDLAKRY